MEALRGCPMLLIGVTGIRRKRRRYEKSFNEAWQFCHSLQHQVWLSHSGCREFSADLKPTSLCTSWKYSHAVLKFNI
jgi:hypothetical protein